MPDCASAEHQSVERATEEVIPVRATPGSNVPSLPSPGADIAWYCDRAWRDYSDSVTWIAR